MIVDTNPFPNVPTNMISTSRWNFNTEGIKRKTPRQMEWRPKRLSRESNKVEKCSTSSPRPLRSIVKRPSVFERLKFPNQSKVGSASSQIFDRLQFPKVDEKPIP